MSEPMNFKDMTEEEIHVLCSEKEASVKEMQEMTLQLLKANEELRAGDASKQKFMSLIRNEFNNPMSTLLNLGKRLADKKNNMDIQKVHDIGAMLHSELLRMDFQLKNIFAMTELESGLLSNTYSLVDLQQFIDDAQEEFTYLIDEKKMNFTFDIDQKIKLVTDGDKLYLILLNFISNACEFSKACSSISVSLYKEDEKIVLKVDNDGSELPKLENMDDIFSTFTSYNPNALRSSSGLGIGLSVARSMAEQLGASIAYVSGSGITSFLLILPQRELKDGEVSFGSQEVFFDAFSGEDGEDVLEF